MAQTRAFRSVLDYRTYLLLLIILNDDIISSGIERKYSINSVIICKLKIQPEVSKRKQFDHKGKIFEFPIFWGKKK